jgi:hypothetical protein
LSNSFDVEEKPPIKIFVAVQATHDVFSGKKTKERERKELNNGKGYQRKKEWRGEGWRQRHTSFSGDSHEGGTYSFSRTYGRMSVFFKRGFRASFT